MSVASIGKLECEPFLSIIIIRGIYKMLGMKW